ncbi:hypothetical protein JYT22_00535 [Endomicrobium sp. AH-315-J14]|nr:hypothetical protein [Endomicrobium sp. AH-315-J14]
MSFLASRLLPTFALLAASALLVTSAGCTFRLGDDDGHFDDFEHEAICADPEEGSSTPACESNADCFVGEFCAEAGQCQDSDLCGSDLDCGNEEKCDNRSTCVPDVSGEVENPTKNPIKEPTITYNKLPKETDCEARKDCKTVYAGVDCSCGADCSCVGGEPNCVCATFEYFKCEDAEPETTTEEPAS